MQQQSKDDEIHKSLDVPSDLICPLTLEVFTDPLVSKHGHNYEREAILEWLAAGNQDCPLTRKPLTPSMLFPNAKLRLKIRSWQQANELEVSCLYLDCGDSVVVGETFFFSSKDLASHMKKKNREAGRSATSLRNQGTVQVVG